MQPRDLDKFPEEKCGVSTSGHLEVGILQSAAAPLLDYIILLKSVVCVHLNTQITHHLGAYICIPLCVSVDLFQMLCVGEEDLLSVFPCMCVRVCEGVKW